MGILNKDTGIAAFVAGAQDRLLCSDLAYGVSAPLGGGVVMSQRWRGLNGTVDGGAAVLGGAVVRTAEPFSHPAQAPVMRRTVLAPYPERPPV